MIQLQHITKRFGKLTVLDDISFSIERGGTFAVLGPNGSGKTTILKIILGMVLPQKGEVSIDGNKILKTWDYRKGVRYLPQIAQFPDNLTVNELIKMIKDLRNMPSREDEIIELIGLSKFLDKKLGNLSGGTRQKVNIVLAFMFDSPILILDEPTAGLDPVSLIRLKELIEKEKSEGKIILITTHILSLVESLADEIIFLLEGNIHFRGTLDELSNKTGEEDLEHSIASLLE
ncbi:MAG: ABC transporter ATP-binding protein [Cyclobacteriaceae bacterium]